MRYQILKTNITDPSATSPEWEKANVGRIEVQRWKEFHQPIETTFKILKGPEGISVLLHTNEKNLKAECLEENGNICMDSCMEFFFKPDPWDLNYMNIEINPKGIMHIGIGKDRYGREPIWEDRKTFSLESIPNEGDWTLKFYLPYDFLLKYYKKIAPVCRGNFYKCGEGTDHSHFITWSEVEVENPDFHIADFFGKFEFED